MAIGDAGITVDKLERGSWNTEWTVDVDRQSRKGLLDRFKVRTQVPTGMNHDMLFVACEQISRGEEPRGLNTKGYGSRL